MPFLSQPEFDKARRVLATAFTEAQLQTQLRQVDKNLAEGRSDSAEATLRQYRALLTSAIAEKQRPHAKADAGAPSPEQLAKKYSGPRTR